ncbi:cysteine peptidase family C39 domain-containing protein [Thalassotalea sp. 1_MG-2023]|uniref:cysteine peptidase family C39 domain-containing protein n=1 Tax=Thalassotalea sp. 1_MG-2023 TaxID=3062680 RepID=UPI0034A10406
MTQLNKSTFLNFTTGRRVELILQSEIAECGLAFLAMVASYHVHQLDMPAMRKRFPANLKGMNLQQFVELADSLSLASRALQCSADEIHKQQTPCILHWDMNHFVVITKVSGKGNVARFALLALQLRYTKNKQKSLNSIDSQHESIEEIANTLRIPNTIKWLAIKVNRHQQHIEQVLILTEKKFYHYSMI